MTAKDMFALDVLGLFLLRNRQYMTHCSGLSSIIKKATLQAIFGQALGQPFQSQQLYERVQFYQVWCTFDLECEFSELISTISLIQLKYRICNNKGRHGKIQNKNDSKEIPKFMFQKRLEQVKGKNRPSIKTFQYRFCELIFSFIGSQVGSRPKHIQLQIKNALSFIFREISEYTRKSEFLQVKYRYNIDIRSLQQQYLQIIAKQEESQQLSVERIHKMTRMYVMRDLVPIKMSEMHTHQQSKMVAADNIVFQTFYETAKKNHFILKTYLATIFSQEISKKQRRLFVQRIKLSYNQMSLLKYKNKRNLLKKDMKMQLILGASKCGTFFLHVQRNASTSQEYCRLLKSIITPKDYTFCTLVLCQQTKTNNISQQSFFDLYWYCLLELKSTFYVTPLITQFYLHQLFAIIVVKHLLETDLSKQYFYKSVQIIAEQVLAFFQEQSQPQFVKGLSQLRSKEHSLTKQVRQDQK